MNTWQMQHAKARLAEVIKVAQTQGPQEITVHHQSVAVVLSRADYDKLTGTGESLAAFMRRSPLYGADDLQFSRNPDLTRELEL